MPFALALLAGCRRSHPMDPLNELLEQLYADTCVSCPAGLGAASFDECAAMAESYVATPVQMTWIRDVYDRHAAELGPAYADCYVTALTAYDICVRAAIATCPPAMGVVEGCGGEYAVSLSACPRPSPDVATMFQDCRRL